MALIRVDIRARVAVRVCDVGSQHLKWVKTRGKLMRNWGRRERGKDRISERRESPRLNLRLNVEFLREGESRTAQRMGRRRTSPRAESTSSRTSGRTSRSGRSWGFGFPACPATGPARSSAAFARARRFSAWKGPRRTPPLTRRRASPPGSASVRTSRCIAGWSDREAPLSVMVPSRDEAPFAPPFRAERRISYAARHPAEACEMLRFARQSRERYSLTRAGPKFCHSAMRPFLK